MTDAAPLMLTPRQTAERLGVGLGTLRKHAASVEALTGAPLPRGEHLERLWPEPLVSMLGEALDMVRRHEAVSVGGALEALHHPAALGARAPTTPPLAPLLDVPEALRQLIREEVRAAVHEAFRAMVHGELRAMLAALPSGVPAPAGVDAVRLAVREELAGLRASPGLQTPAPARRRAAGKASGVKRGKGASPPAEAPSRPPETPAPRPRLTGRSAALLTHLENGGELVDGGGMFRVEVAGRVVQSYAPAAAQRLLDVPGLLRQIVPERWTLAET